MAQKLNLGWAGLSESCMDYNYWALAHILPKCDFFF